MIRRYVAFFALVGFLGTILFSFFSEAPLAEVIGQAAFWAFLGGIFGLGIGYAAQRFIEEIPIPSTEEEVEDTRIERFLARHGGDRFGTEKIDHQRTQGEGLGNRGSAGESVDPPRSSDSLARPEPI